VDVVPVEPRVEGFSTVGDDATDAGGATEPDSERPEQLTAAITTTDKPITTAR